MKELTLEEKWEQAGLENGFIFYKVMRNQPKACKQLLEILLHIQIDTIEIKEEETIMVDNGAKGIRLDIYLKNDTHVFDIELQVSNTSELAERARYYTGLMDIDTLKSGEFYIELKTSHVIFICIKDIFHQGLPVYTFENICNEDNSVKLNDRAYKHFFIAENYAKIKDEEQKAFLSFLFNKVATNSYTAELNRCVEIAKQNSQWRHTYMEWERQRAYDRREGIQQNKFETAQKLFEMNLGNDEQIAQATGLSLEEVLEIKRSVFVTK